MHRDLIYRPLFDTIFHRLVYKQNLGWVTKVALAKISCPEFWSLWTQLSFVDISVLIMIIGRWLPLCELPLDKVIFWRQFLLIALRWLRQCITLRLIVASFFTIARATFSLKVSITLCWYLCYILNMSRVWGVFTVLRLAYFWEAVIVRLFASMCPKICSFSFLQVAKLSKIRLCWLIFLICVLVRRNKQTRWCFWVSLLFKAYFVWLRLIDLCDHRCFILSIDLLFLISFSDRIDPLFLKRLWEGRWRYMRIQISLCFKKSAVYYFDIAWDLWRHCSSRHGSACGAIIAQHGRWLRNFLATRARKWSERMKRTWPGFAHLLLLFPAPG